MVYCIILVYLLLLCYGTGYCQESGNERAYKECLKNCNYSSQCFCQVSNPFDGVVNCVSNQPQITPLMCVTTSTSDNNETLIIAGECPFTGQSQSVNLSNTPITDINNKVCGPADRTGMLCGKCKQDFGLAINTFGLTCINGSLCHSYNWAIYFGIEFIVLTTFLLFVLILNIKATAECANAFILFAQIISLPINIVTVQRDWSVINGVDLNTAEKLAWFVDIVYGIWSLNVPSGSIHYLCTNKNMSSLEAFSLRYVTAWYPLMMIIIGFLLIKLHQRGFKIVTLLWLPFRKCCIRFRRRIDPKTTIVDTFATFTLLSYTKFTHISLIILAPTSIYDISGRIQSTALLYDANIRYFDSTHRGFAILAIVILIIFVIPLPILLIFYSARPFQKALHCLRLNSHALTLFVQAFQNGYRDGSEGEGERGAKPRDCRFFAGINFIIRFAVLSVYTFISNYFILYLVVSIIISFYMAMIIIFKPYKNDLFNKIESLLLIAFNIIISLAVFNNIRIIQFKQSLGLQTVFYLALFFPALYMGTYMSIWCIKKICHYCRRDLRYSLNEEGQPRTRFGRLIQSIHNQDNHSLPSPVEDRDGRDLVNDFPIDDEYSSSYVDYCETPVGTNNTTERSTLQTDRSTLPLVNNSTNNTRANSFDRSTSRYNTTRWPLSLRANRIREDMIALTKTS